MAKTRIGFDIGSSSMKIAVVRGNTVRLEEVRLPENLMEGDTITMPNAFTQFLKQNRKELKLPRRAPASLVLPAGQVICRLVTMPQMTEEQMMMNLPYEFADFIQGGADQYFCDYAACQPIEGEEDTIPMMAAAAEKRCLEEYARMFARAGVRLRTVLPQEMALIGLARAHRKRTEGPEEYCFVDLGQQRTRITVVWRDRVQATRQIGIGGQDLDRVIGEELGVDAFLANSYKTAGREESLAVPAVGELCEQIAVEILKVVNFYQFTYRNSALAGIYLVGGGANLSPLRRAIAERVGLEVLDERELLADAENGSGAATCACAAGGCFACMQ